MRQRTVAKVGEVGGDRRIRRRVIDQHQPVSPRRVVEHAADASRERFQQELAKSGFGEITTEIAEAGPFYYAEPYHQQYLAKNPNGYCGLGGTGVACPVGLKTA